MDREILNFNGPTVVGLAVLLGGVLAFAGVSSAATPLSVLTGRSVANRRIEAYALGSGGRSVLIVAGIHGNERSGVTLIGHFERWARKRWVSHSNCRLIVVPDVNPDGHARNTRTNADGVDLNRNFPARDWGTRPRRKRDYPGPRPASEPETRFILKLITRFRPSLIISVHAPYHQLNIDGPALRFARHMHRFNHYRITRWIGYPTPGSLGTYVGKERHVPVVTLELASSVRGSWEVNRPALLAAIEDACGRPPSRSG